MKNRRGTLIFVFILSLLAFYIFNKSAGFYQSLSNLDENFLAKTSLTIENIPNEIKINFLKFT